MRVRHGGARLALPRPRARLLERLRAHGVADAAVLAALAAVPRERFVEEALAGRAHDSHALPIGFGQAISQPLVAARMTEALLAGRPRPERVLEIGTGSGYQTAVLALLAGRVYSIERIARLAARARERLATLGVRNVRLRHGDGRLGWPEHGPFDGILIAAAGPGVPVALGGQLAIGGRLVAPVGQPGRQELLLLERRALGFEARSLGPAHFVPLLEGVS